MKNRMIPTAGLVLLFAFSAVQSEPEKRASDERGRYEGVTASANAVWVVDTHTGAVRKCTQEFSDQTPVCSGYSK